MKKTLVRLVDDLDGGEAQESVSFALDGVRYEIDLSLQNASTLRKALDDYVSHARKVGGAPARVHRSSSRSSTTRDVAQTRAIRSWAQSHGHDVSSRGRIPAAVLAAYEEAHAA